VGSNRETVASGSEWEGAVQISVAEGSAHSAALAASSMTSIENLLPQFDFPPLSVKSSGDAACFVVVQ
jgi:hypothetical protein